MEQNTKQWIEQIADIISVLCDKYPYSKEFAKLCNSDDLYFVDSNNFVGLHYELQELELTLRNLLRYANMYKGVDK